VNICTFSVLKPMSPESRIHWLYSRYTHEFYVQRPGDIATFDTKEGKCYVARLYQNTHLTWGGDLIDTRDSGARQYVYAVALLR